MKRYIYILLLLFSQSSCIENNIPYPVVELYITNIEGEGFEMSSPNNAERTIVLELDETTSIEEVRFSSVSYSPEREIESTLELEQSFDMRMPLSITLSLYQDYIWTVSANQNIERYFKVQNQIGSEEIDYSTKSATAYVSESTDLNNIEITSLKLGPEDITTYDITLEELTTFSSYRVVNISYHNTTERWKLYVLQTDIKVSITEYDIRATTATLTAAGQSSEDIGFRYRVSGESEWSDATDEISVSSGQFSTTISGLTPATEYEFVAYIDEDISEVVSLSTESVIELPNSDFEEWSFPSTYNGSNNKSWFPFLEDGEQYWGTGNQGATTLGDSFNLTTPTEDVRPGSAGVTAASLQSKNTLKFATGSIFTGTYIKTAGTNGIIGLGRPFTSRPWGVKGWMKYNQGVVDMVGTIPPGVDIVKGESYDQGSIYIALGTWDPAEYGTSAYETTQLSSDQIPMIIDTRDTATFFDKSGKDVVAYGELILSDSVDEWMEFTIELNYYSLDVTPTHIIIVCSASRYGDYFTGSSQSLMLLDDLELIWE